MTATSEEETIREAFERHRRFLWGLCYRMTGSAADAEDLVQDTFERALTSPPADLRRELRPWLAKVAVNASRDQLRRRKKQPYPGPWLPGPIEASPDDPDWQGHESAEARYGRLESVSFAFLHALEALTPSQRAVLLLRDVFDFDGGETAAILETSEGNVKVQLHRARAAMARYDATPRTATAEERRRAYAALQALIGHAARGDTEALRSLLRDDAVLYNDGGGVVFAARRPVRGVDRIVTFYRKTRRDEPPRLAFVELNGIPAVVAEYPPAKPGLPTRMVGWIELDDDGRIARIHAVMAPRKLVGIDFDALPPATRVESGQGAGDDGLRA